MTSCHMLAAPCNLGHAHRAEQRRARAVPPPCRAVCRAVPCRATLHLPRACATAAAAAAAAALARPLVPYVCAMAHRGGVTVIAMRELLYICILHEWWGEERGQAHIPVHDVSVASCRLSALERLKQITNNIHAGSPPPTPTAESAAAAEPAWGQVFVRKM